MKMQYFTESTSLLGAVANVNPADACFTLRCRSGDSFLIQVSSQTTFGVLRNLDGLDRDRVPAPTDFNPDAGSSEILRKYIHPDALVVVQGIYIEHEEQTGFNARYVTLMHFAPGQYLFEETHWWLTQIARLADEWLDDLFGDKRTYDLDDFAALYRTNLNDSRPGHRQQYTGMRHAIPPYLRLSSAYLLTGSERYLLAAKAGVEYQRDTFRSLTYDGQRCFWHFGKRKRDVGVQTIVASENADDRDTIPLYEQIYALAGLAQYYRVTQDWEVLEDIQRTVTAFQTTWIRANLASEGWGVLLPPRLCHAAARHRGPRSEPAT